MASRRLAAVLRPQPQQVRDAPVVSMAPEVVARAEPSSDQGEDDQREEHSTHETTMRRLPEAVKPTAHGRVTPVTLPNIWWPLEPDAACSQPRGTEAPLPETAYASRPPSDGGSDVSGSLRVARAALRNHAIRVTLFAFLF